MEKKLEIIGQGHGLAGNYAGLPSPYCDLSFAKIVLLPVPFDLTTTYQKGSDKGPDALIEASRNLELYDIETDTEVYLHGIHTAASIREINSVNMLEAVYHQTKKFLEQGKFVVAVGGEHAISYAPIRAHAEQYKNITVLQLDAHTDLQEAYEGDPWSHASVMARVKEISSVDKIVAVGIRSMAAEEKIHFDEDNTFYAHMLDLDEIWIEHVLDRLSGQVYVTFDLDVFDISLMPSTGTPEPGGLQWNPILRLLKRVAEEKQIVGFDVVELCPNPANVAPDYLAAKLIYKILSFIFNARDS